MATELERQWGNRTASSYVLEVTRIGSNTKLLVFLVLSIAPNVEEIYFNAKALIGKINKTLSLAGMSPACDFDQIKVTSLNPVQGKPAILMYRDSLRDDFADNIVEAAKAQGFIIR